jgi:hypothetical protein
MGLAVLIAPRALCGPTSMPAQPDPAFTAVLLDGRTTSGRLVSLGPGVITLASAEGARHELPLAKVFKLTREAPSRPSIVRWSCCLTAIA